MKNVTKITQSNLCVSCEACKKICPTDAIEMVFKKGQFFPVLDKSTCIDCGRCIKVCYGDNIETDKVDSGDYISVYDAYVPEEDIRKNSTSGAVISRLIVAMLENNEIEGAFVLDFDNFFGEPIRLKLVRSPKEVYNAAGSKYIPASVFNILDMVKEHNSYVMVGTPCMIYAVKNYLEEQNLEINIFFFGLFCDRTMNFNFLKYMQDRFGRGNETLQKLDYRNKEKRGWPGDVKLYFDSGRELIVNKRERTKVKDYFQLERCLYCLDKLNRHADISFGDCYIHGKEYPERTSVIVRTSRGKKLFDKYSSFLITNDSSLESIEISQGMRKRKKHLKRAKLLNSRDTSKDLKTRKKKIRLGQNYSRIRLKTALKFSFVKNAWKHFSKTSESILNLLKTSAKDNKTNRTGNILITGGGLSNKGAQAMTFTAISNIKKNFPSHNIYLLNSEDYQRDLHEKEKYSFDIIHWDNPLNSDLKFKILRDKEHPYQKIIEKTDMILDVSGYRLTSQSRPPYLGAYNYMLDIKIAKKFSIPMYLLPQSIGPFNYLSPEFPILWLLHKKYLKFPEIIYPREREGEKAIKKFTSENVKRRHDLVLTDDYEVESVFEGSKKDLKVEEPAVGVVPNEKVSRRMDYEVMLNFYEKAIKKLRQEGFVVYLIRHSNPDISIINDLKDLFLEDEGVKSVAEELYAFELENLISKLEFMIASRYHSIIHAYRNEVPCLVLGWAVKYQELLNDFSQSEYIFDVRSGINTSEILEKLEDLVEKHRDESKTVRSNLEKIKRNEGSIFNEILNDFSN